VIDDASAPGPLGALRTGFDEAFSRPLVRPAEGGAIAARTAHAAESGEETVDKTCDAFVLRAASRSGSDTETSPASPKRILAVDDSSAYRDLLSEMLRDEGFEIIQARSGEEALELLSVQLVDCVLLDLFMPGIGGHETCRRLKSDAATREIPVIVLTTLEDRSAVVDGLALGADDFVPKSADFDVLKARVRAQLRRRQLEDEARRVRERLLRSEMEAAEARAARELANTRAALVEQLRSKNDELETAWPTPLPSRPSRVG
jgi:DNA-binding response OmpR family regulator